ncbi:MAG: TonB-dependent receptor domain-containing protein [Acidobacteriota bacterium]
MRLSLSIDICRRTLSSLLVFFALLASSSPGSAQAQSGISGRVVDVTGAVVPGAAVGLRRENGQVVGDTVTDAAGGFTFPVLDADRYVITAALEGFSLARVELSVTRFPATLELVLRPGAFAEDLTVIGSRLAGSEEMLRRLPGSFHLLTRDTLTASHVFSTSEALRKVPGVIVRDEEGLGLRPNIGIRGLNPTRSAKVLLLEDGVPTAFAPYGDNASYYHPPIDRFDRVEVLKGSSQIAYGPVTLGGVINYITPEAPVRPSFALDVTGGNRAYANVGGSFGGTWSRTGVFAQAARKQSNGARDHVHSDLLDVMGKATRSFGATQQLSVKGNYYGEDSQVTYSGLSDAEFATNPRQNPFANDVFDGGRVGVSGAYRAVAWSRVALTGTVYASRFARDWWRQSSNSGQRPNDAADRQCGGMANLSTTCGNEGRLRRYRHAGAEARGRVAFRAGMAQETDFGVRVHKEYQDRRQENGATPLARTGVLVENNERTADAQSAFVQHRVLAGAWTVTPGLRVERIRYSRTNRLALVSGATDLTELVPGLGVSYGPTPDATLFGGVHRGFAPPRAEDIINNTTGGTIDLEPERSWNYEVGGRTRLGSTLRLDAALFRLDYENQIVPASLAGGVGATLTNGGETLQQGVEMGADGDWRRLRGTGHGLYSRAAFTWLPVARFTGVRSSNVAGFTTTSVSGNRLPYAPETTVSVTVGYRHEAGLDVEIEAQHVGDQVGDDLNTIAGTADGQRGLIPAYTYWNLAASWRVSRLPGSLFLAIKNVADRTFIVDRTRGILPGHPRLLQIGTSWRF